MENSWGAFPGRNIYDLLEECQAFFVGYGQNPPSLCQWRESRFQIVAPLPFIKGKGLGDGF